MSPTKVAVAGEGGLVATNDEGLAADVRLGRDYGNPGNYDCEFPGLNARMSELHAAVGLASLQGLDERIAHRNELVRAFKAAAASVPGLSYQQVPDEDVSTYKDLTLVIDDEQFGLTAELLGQALKAEGIDSRRYYYPPIHQQKAYAHLPRNRELPVTDRMAASVLTPPLYSHMTVDQVRAVADAVVRVQESASAGPVGAGVSLARAPPSRPRRARRRAQRRPVGCRRATRSASSGTPSSWRPVARRSPTFLLRRPAPTATTTSWRRSDDGLRRRRPGTAGAAGAARGDCLETIQWLVNQRVIEGLTEHETGIHAACAQRGDDIVLIPAPSGSGKSTTVAGLVRAGWDYLTDETTVLDDETLTVRAYPKPITIDHGAWPLFPETDLLPRSADSCLVPLAASGRGRRSRWAGHGQVVFPTFQRVSRRSWSRCRRPRSSWHWRLHLRVQQRGRPAPAGAGPTGPVRARPPAGHRRPPRNGRRDRDPRGGAPMSRA